LGVVFRSPLNTVELVHLEQNTDHDTCMLRNPESSYRRVPFLTLIPLINKDNKNKKQRELISSISFYFFSDCNKPGYLEHKYLALRF